MNEDPHFGLTYLMEDGSRQHGRLYAPKDATFEDALAVAQRSAPLYGIQAETIEVYKRETVRPNWGFRTPLEAPLPDGGRAVVQGWYV